MNCQDFESVSMELARGSLIDAAALADATSHTEACAACATRLRRERALTSALREAGAAMRDMEAPARVEAALLAAFRERRDVVSANANVGANDSRRDAAATQIVSLASTRYATNVRRALVVAAIAASLVVAASLAWRAASTKAPGGGAAINTSSQPQPTTTGNTQEIAKQVALGSQSSKVALGSQSSTDHDRQPLTSTTVAGFAPSKSRASRLTSRRGVSNGTDALPISFKEDGGRIVFSESATIPQGASNPATSASGTATTTADFVPLVTADGSAPLDGGQMVRVRVPRAALAALGLPVSGERAGETVKADVLLAQDGTARAIRLLP
jgi:hypothetical protein